VDTGLSPIDPDAVDLQKHPRVTEVQWYRSTLHAGDILYIPQYWWHQLQGQGSPSVAVSMWIQSFQFDSRYTVSDSMVVETTAQFEEFLKDEPATITCLPGQYAFGRISTRLGNASEYAKNADTRPTMPPAGITAKISLSQTIPNTTVPAVMLGTAKLGDDAEAVITAALTVGYRGFDSGAIRGYSEATLGRVLQESGLARDKFFITAKLNPRDHGYDSTLTSVRASLDDLKTDYVDLLLIHTPYCDLAEDGTCIEGPTLWRDSWRAFEDLHAEGIARQLGVSNFEVSELEHLLSFATVKPALVQNWFDPLHRDRPVRQWCRANNVGFQAYSVLGSAWKEDGALVNPVLTDKRVISMAFGKMRSPAQVVLRWAMQSGVGVIVGAKSVEHLTLDLSLGDFELSTAEVKIINRLGHNAKAFATSDDCLAQRCAKRWTACEKASACATCEKSCENVDSDDEYIRCSEACVGGKGEAAVEAMQGLLKCFRYCLRFDATDK